MLLTRVVVVVVVVVVVAVVLVAIVACQSAALSARGPFPWELRKLTYGDAQLLSRIGSSSAVPQL